MKKKNYINIFALTSLMAFTASCSEDELSSESIFKDKVEAKSDFDQWLYKNFTEPYNINVNYRYNDAETHRNYNVIPADSAKSVVMAHLLKELWINSYASAVGEDFVKTYAPRIYQFIGSAEYSSSGTLNMGVAEGGIKVTLTQINLIDPDNLYFEIDTPHPDLNPSSALDLNEEFFHTMHHEFCHILTQTKDYSTEFRTITTDTYNPNGWNNTRFADVVQLGYVTPYATKEYNEDFAEIYSTYVTHTPEAWQTLLTLSLTLQVDANGNTVYEQDANGNYVYFTDENGNKILDRDANGNLIPETDTDGNIIYGGYVTDENGQLKYATDANGYLVPKKDANGNIIYQHDANGNLVYWIYKGSKDTDYHTVKKTELTTVGNVWRFGSDGQLICYFLNSNKYYNASTNEAWGASNSSYIYQLDANGNQVLDEEGNPIPELFAVPEWEYEREIKYQYARVPAYDTTGRDNLLRKLEIVRDYFETSWGIDIDEVRDEVIKRTRNIENLDLKSLK